MDLFLYIVMLAVCKYGTLAHLLQAKPKDAKALVLFGSYNTNIIVDMVGHAECIIHFPTSNSKYPYTVFVWSNTNNFDYPIIVTFRQQRFATSWELPLAVPSKINNFKFYNTSRTLCHNRMDLISRIPRNSIGNKKFNLTKELSISLTTFSEVVVPVTIRVEEPDNFYVEEHIQYSIHISPSEPRFFYYKFPQRKVEDFSTTVVLDIESEDDICLTVSIQNASCPVYDLNPVISFRGKYQTIDTRGGIIVKKSEFHSGFFIVFVAKGDNFDCSHKKSGKSLLPETVQSTDRLSKVLFKIKPTIQKEGYLHASILIVVATLIFYTVILTLSWALLHVKFRFKGKWCGSGTHKVKNATDASVHTEVHNTVQLHDTSPECVPLSITSRGKSLEELQCKGVLVLSDLAKKDTEHFQKTSYNYLWHLLSIAIFYGIPSVQLVVSHQRIVNTSGNQDLCYYNFLCAHPLLGFSDFNHIFSNIGYILAGIAFFIIILYRDTHSKESEQETGIPKQYGLYQAMSVALIMEGILSACYHICPNQSNFQFDTSFMYIMVTLSLVKLYQNRHPDVNATAYATFLVLGLGIFAAMVGVISGHLVLWILFVIVYTSLCIYLSLKVYFIRNAVQGLKNFDLQRRSDGVLVAIRPVKKDRFYVVLFGNIINILMATVLCYVFYGDFATYLLALLIANAILYTTTYIFMKKRNGERICIRAKIFTLMALAAWGASGYFFINNSTDWKVTAAKSRQLNKECVVLGFYDHHDIWHLLSAPALFFSFMMLLCLDDDIINTTRDKIVVF